MIATIYEGFYKSAELAPKNAKMILRHSLRDKIPKNEMGNDILLTREGEVMAEHFGRHCKLSLSCLHTSVVERCKQTASLLAKGYQQTHKILLPITPTHVLTDSYINDLSKVAKLFKTHSPYWIISAFLRGEELDGMRSVNESMNLLFSYIFKNQSDEMEVFITHDTFLIAIVCFCHGIQPELDDFSWPYMLEGAFLYLEGERIYCIFRGKTKSIAFDFKK